MQLIYSRCQLFCGETSDDNTLYLVSRSILAPHLPREGPKFTISPSGDI